MALKRFRLAALTFKAHVKPRGFSSESLTPLSISPPEELPALLPTLASRYPVPFHASLAALSPRRQTALDHPAVKFLPGPNANYVFLGTHMNFGRSSPAALPDLVEFLRLLHPHIVGLQFDFHRGSLVKKFYWLQAMSKIRSFTLTPQIENSLDCDLARLYGLVVENHLPFFHLDAERPGPIESRWVNLKDRLFSRKRIEEIPPHVLENSRQLASTDFSSLTYERTREILEVYSYLFPNYKRVFFDERIPYMARFLQRAERVYQKERVGEKPVIFLGMSIAYVEMMENCLKQLIFQNNKK